MTMNWHDARVVVTGAASGIGRALAMAAAEKGARIAAVDVRQEGAERTAAEIAASGGTAIGYGCDVGQAAEVQALATKVAAALGGVDVVFNNAGVGVGGKLESVSADDAAWVMSVNLAGIINGVRAFVPLLREAAAAGRTAWIVNTGSEHSLGVPDIGAMNVYTATKHAALGLSDVLRSDLAGSGVNVALLCPGLVSTSMFDAKANRPAAFGGPASLSAEHRDRAKAFMAAQGQDPAMTARLCFEGLDRGDFLIITDPKIGGFARRRMAEIEQAIITIEARLATP